jgi:chemotaxis protein MotA
MIAAWLTGVELSCQLRATDPARSHDVVSPSPKTPYSRAPILGAAFGLALILSPIALGARGYLLFFGFLGLVIVIGGVIAVAFMSFSANEVSRALQAIVRMLKQTPSQVDDLAGDMESIVKWSAEIRTKGMRNFESRVKGFVFKDAVVEYGVNMVLSEYAPDDVRSMMLTAADSCYEHDSRPADILEAMTSHAPAFGMVGTLIGMVAMLGNLTSNISDISATLAVAFLSTLYGVLSARMIYMPAATRLRQEVERQRFRHQFLAEGMSMLAGKKAPTYIQDRLNGFLRPESQNYFQIFSAAAKPAAPLPRLKVVGA